MTDWESLLSSALKIGLTPQQFWKMTFRELYLMGKAYWWRYDIEGLRLAHFTAVLARPFYKKKNLSARHLWKMRDEKRDVVSKEEHQRRFERAVKLMGPDAIPVKIGK
jgi:hypothetical protein